MEIKEVNDEVPSSGTNKPNSDPSSSSSIKVEGFEADEEQRLVNKLDRLILPLAAFLYVSDFFSLFSLSFMMKFFFLFRKWEK